ncbi:MAG: TetR/AcrR family transcriptional regulator [Oscillospiraceae bacterium]|nr:TetR/AcrR family transcriptional regulator [Oscillospiraceae bacterium]
MGRKKVLEGGTRDKIIDQAMHLFFENGYEATSIRMILDTVNGEIGMFYHYFKSKDELFQVVVERFFKDYSLKFTGMTKICGSREQFIDILFDYVEEGNSNFNKISDKLHWTISYAFAARTIESLQPAIAQMLKGWEYLSQLSPDLLANQLLYAISGTIHTPSYREINTEDKKIIIRDLIDKILDN